MHVLIVSTGKFSPMNRGALSAIRRRFSTQLIEKSYSSNEEEPIRPIVDLLTKGTEARPDVILLHLTGTGEAIINAIEKETGVRIIYDSSKHIASAYVLAPLMEIFPQLLSLFILYYRKNT